MAEVALDGVSKVFEDGTRAVDGMNLEIEDGEFMVLVGPSGCGKTTALRMVAGLEEITEGTLRIGDRIVNDLTPRERDIAMVFQSYALYPHLSVYDNIAFSLKLHKVAKEEIDKRVRDAARILDLEPYLKRKPKALSGGQRQRVAMGRAIVRQPSAFLMDEPLSNLDAKLRVQMRAEIKKLQGGLGVTTIYVTHDQVEAMTMGDRVSVMRKGVLQQVAGPEELYERPRNMFVAGFIGSPAMNMLEAKLEQDGDGLVCRVGSATLKLPASALSTRPALARYVGRSIAVGIRPETLDHAGPMDGDDGGRLRGIVRVVEALGPELLVHVEVDAKPVLADEVIEGLVDMEQADELAEILPDAEGDQSTLVARLDASASVRPDDVIDLSVDLPKLHFFELESGVTIGA